MKRRVYCLESFNSIQYIIGSNRFALSLVAQNEVQKPRDLVSKLLTSFFKGILTLNSTLISYPKQHRILECNPFKRLHNPTIT